MRYAITFGGGVLFAIILHFGFGLGLHDPAWWGLIFTFGIGFTFVVDWVR